MRLLICAAMVLALHGATEARAQDMAPLVESEDTRHFDYLLGTWYPVVDGRVDSTGFSFRISRSVHPGAFLEEWFSNGAMVAHALRAWDKSNRRWMYTWVSSNGLYQVWEGRRDDGRWYIYNRFDIDGDRYLSRQGWIPQADGRVLRVSQKSYDEGKTWELRFQQLLVRTDGSQP